ncbi:FAD-dependent oxidoreductase, partial [Chloroflexota bacterium]
SWADPEVFNKALENRIRDIRPCVNCNYCNETGNIGVWRGDCAINPGMGRSEEAAIKKAEASKKVLVVGGGPGGMEAARIAAFRGHKVTLMEKGSKLGGTVLTSYNVIGTEEYLRPFIEWEERQCKKLGVKIQLNKKVTARDVADFKPDAVIVASGAIPFVPSELGAGKANMVIAEDIINGKAKVGGKVVVVGGAVVGMETAELIVTKGMSKDVTVLEKLPMAMLGGDPVFMAYFMQNVLPNLPINILTDMNVVQITGKVVVAFDKQEFKADYVVMATGYTPDSALYDSIKGKYKDVYNIGDSRKPRRIMDAVHEAYYFAQQI